MRPKDRSSLNGRSSVRDRRETRGNTGGVGRSRLGEAKGGDKEYHHQQRPKLTGDETYYFLEIDTRPFRTILEEELLYDLRSP